MARAVDGFFPLAAPPVTNRRVLAVLLALGFFGRRHLFFVFFWFEEWWHGPLFLTVALVVVLALFTPDFARRTKGLLFLALASGFLPAVLADTGIPLWGRLPAAALVGGVFLLFFIALPETGLWVGLEAASSIASGLVGRWGKSPSLKERIDRFRKHQSSLPNFFFRMPSAPDAPGPGLALFTLLAWLLVAQVLLLLSRSAEGPVEGWNGFSGVPFWTLSLAGLLALVPSLHIAWRALLLVGASLLLGGSLQLLFPQVACQGWETHLLRTLWAGAVLAVPFATGRWALTRRTRTAVGVGLAIACAVVLTPAAWRVSGRTVDFPVLIDALERSFQDRSGGSRFWELNFKIDLCGCWQEPGFQKAYAEMVARVAPAGTRRCQFEQTRIDEPAVASWLLEALLRKRSLGTILLAAPDLVSRLPEPEREEWVGRLLSAYESAKSGGLSRSEQPADWPLRDCVPDLAALVVQEDPSCSIPVLFELYRDCPETGVALPILSICRRTGYRLNREEMLELFYRYRPDRGYQLSNPDCNFDYRPELIYWAELTQNPGEARAIITEVFPDMDEDYFQRVLAKESFERWAQQNLDPSHEGQGMDLSVAELWD